MDIPAKLKRERRGSLRQHSAEPSSRRAGMALFSVIFALMAVGLLSAGVFVLTDAQQRSVQNREATTRALLLAEEGIAHALAVVRDTLRADSGTGLLLGSDRAGNTADDGLLIGYGLSSAAQIPAAGKVTPRGTYTVTLSDDPNDGDANPLSDTNGRIRMRCTAVTVRGASATIDVIVGATWPPAMATDGNLTINGNPALLGKCGGAHANLVAIVSGTPTVSTNVSASQTVDVSGRILDTLKQPVAPLENQPPVDIPDLDPGEFCPSAAYHLRADGTVLRSSDGAVFDARSDPQFGWKLASSSPIVWDFSGNTGVPGTVCAQGNIKMSGNPGSPGSPLSMSLIATGSITISGNPYLSPSSPDGISVLAGGDVAISGNPAAGAITYEGLIYSRSQCKLNGNPAIAGQVLCKDKPNPPGSSEEADMNAVSGNPTITSNCVGKLAARRQILDWFQPAG